MVNEQTYKSNMDEFKDSSIDLWGLLKGFLNWWWLILIITIVVTGLAAFVLFRMTPEYRAASVLEIKQKEVQVIGGANQNFVADREFFNTQIELLKSETLIENVILELNDVADIRFSNAVGNSLEEKKANAIRLFLRKLTVKQVESSRLIRVSFVHNNPRTAARVSNLVTETFIKYNLERKFNETSYAREFVKQRLQIAREDLERSEKELGKYASENKLLVLGDSDGNTSLGFLEMEDLVSLSSALAASVTKRVELEQKLKLAESEEYAGIGESDKVLDRLRDEHLQLTAEYNENLSIYKPLYPLMVELSARIKKLETLILSETENINSGNILEIKRDYEVALEVERNFQNRVSELKRISEINRAKGVDYTILEREVSINRTQYEALLQRLQEVSVSDDIGSSLISLVDRARAPRVPFSPNIPLVMSLALVLSVLGSFVLIFIIETIDDRIKTPDDIIKKLKSSILGVVPLDESQNEIATQLYDSQSSVAEAYATLRTNLRSLGSVEGGPKVIHITSTKSGEGKSVSALGLALRFCGVNEKVLLIDADMRLPTFFGVEGESEGLSGFLRSTGNEPAQILTTKFDNLSLLPSGNKVSNPSELLSSHKLRGLIEYARDNFDRVIVDSPPVLGIADAITIGLQCDGSLLVVEYSSVRAPAIRATQARLKLGGVNIVGVLMTKYKTQSSGYLNYYQYSYGLQSGQYGKNGKGEKSKAAKKKKFIALS